jgi:SSS family solute:Na+ symporter/sodium/pantothenate symporter
MAASFLAPAFLGCYWRRASAAGALAATLGGALTTIALYAIGCYGRETFGLAAILPPNPDIGAPAAFRPYYLLGFDPCVWGIVVSFALGIVVSLLTRPPSSERLALLFDAQPPSAPAPASLALRDAPGEA